jgi:hypothetical protein
MVGKHHFTEEGLNDILTLFASCRLSPDHVQNTYNMWWTESDIGPILEIFSGLSDIEPQRVKIFRESIVFHHIIMQPCSVILRN